MQRWILLTAVASMAAFSNGANADPTPSLTFPLGGGNAYTAEITSVFDHSMRVSPNSTGVKPYACDEAVVAYTGERGEKRFGSDVSTCGGHPGYKKDIQGTAFKINDHYVGSPAPKYLNYDGHPGIDYRASDGTKVYAAVDGTVAYPDAIVGIPNAYGKFHVLELRPDGRSDYRIYYVHLSTHPSTGVKVPVSDSAPGCPSSVTLPLDPGARVKAGCLIALSGHAGTETSNNPQGAPHLHFEVQRVLPLEQVKATARNYLICKDDLSKACVPVDPYGWTGGETRCNEPMQGDIYECLTGTPSQVLWRSAECQLLSSGAVVPQGFGVPWNVFAPSELLLKAFCTSSGASVAVGSPRNTTLVYKNGYYQSGNDWVPFSYKGVGLINDTWYSGAATANVPYVGDSTHFLAYTCEFVGTAWTCGCRDSACTQSFWQLQQFRRQ